MELMSWAMTDLIAMLIWNLFIEYSFSMTVRYWITSKLSCVVTYDAQIGDGNGQRDQNGDVSGILLSSLYSGQGIDYDKTASYHHDGCEDCEGFAHEFLVEG